MKDMKSMKNKGKNFMPFMFFMVNFSLVLASPGYEFPNMQSGQPFIMRMMGELVFDSRLLRC